jgi:hypothetical protein
MLSNFDIERIADDLDLPIIGVFSKNELPKEREVGSYYINLQSSNEGDGTHWTLAKIYCDEEREENKVRSGEDLMCEALYFDPYGLDMPIEVADFLKPFKPIPYNNRQIQGVNQTECGWYCLLTDYTLEHKQKGETYLEDYNKYLASWSKNPVDNLKMLKIRFRPIKSKKSASLGKI